MSDVERINLDLADDFPDDRKNHLNPDGTVHAKRINVPARGRSDPGDGPSAGYIVDCPACGQWGIIGTDHDCSFDPTDGLTVRGPWECPNSYCDFVGIIAEGEIRAVT